MTTRTAADTALLRIFDEHDVEDATNLTFGTGATNSANAYLRLIGGTEHSAHAWTAGANLAQWGAFRDGEYPGRDIIWTLMESERSTGYGAGSDPVLAQRFDY